MTNANPISDEATRLLTWFSSPPSDSPLTSLLGLNEPCPVTHAWVPASEKERIDNLLLSGSLVLPPPLINLASFQELSRRFSDYFGIDKVAGPSGEFGAIESAMVLAAVGTAVFQSVDLVRAFQAGIGQNPFEIAVKQYIAMAAVGTASGLGLHHALRSAHILHAALKTVPADLLAKAYVLSEQQIILEALDTWNEMAAEAAAQQREEIKKLDISYQETLRKLLAAYIEKARTAQENLKQPILSVLMGSLALDQGTTIPLTSLIRSIMAPANAAAAATPLQTELSVLASGLLASALGWAAPIATTLSSATKNPTDAQLEQDVASAYAQSIAYLLTNDSVQQFITSRIEQAVQQGLISAAKAEIISVSFHASLLLTAMALLYRAEFGGVTGKELQALLTQHMPLLSTNAITVLIDKLLRLELGRLDSSETTAQLIQALTEPYDEDPSMQRLTSSIKLFITLWNPAYTTTANLAKPG